MGYDNVTENCKFAHWCSGSVRCGASEKILCHVIEKIKEHFYRRCLVVKDIMMS